MRSAAVLGPMPSTPGTLSTLSPISAKRSPSRSGATPNFSRTSAGPSSLFFIVSSSWICVGTKLHEILVRGADHDAQAGRHSLPGQSGDSVVGLHPRHRQHRQSECLHHLVGKANLRRQVGGHGRPVGLVRSEDFVTEGRPGRIVDHAQVGRPPIALDTQQHLAQPVHRAGGKALAIGKGRQGVKGAKQEIERVYDVERAVHDAQETTTNPAAIPLHSWLFGLV